LPALAAELVHLKVDVIVTDGTLAPLAAKQATSTIPIVMAPAGDPLGSGLVASLAHPGGNITGLSLMAPDLGGKRLELLKELLPDISRVAILGMLPIRTRRRSSERQTVPPARYGLRCNRLRCAVPVISILCSRLPKSNIQKV
jgi:putative ABC transport system substrate-binding protein